MSIWERDYYRTTDRDELASALRDFNRAYLNEVRRVQRRFYGDHGPLLAPWVASELSKLITPPPRPAPTKGDMDYIEAHKARRATSCNGNCPCRVECPQCGSCEDCEDGRPPCGGDCSCCDGCGHCGSCMG